MWNICNYTFLILFFVSNAKSDDYVIIDTPNGQIQGIESVTLNNNTMYAFRGIRYALPPIGDLRFRAPVPTKPWTGIYDATKSGNFCVQNYHNNTVDGNEDCLFLNVFTTHLNKGANSTLLPVLVWIHGGAFLFGTGNFEVHQADKLLDGGVLVVSINYRLGVLGFLCTEDSSVPGNYGLKDQILALRWVQQNIASFGGDPTRVTIYGESAGAASVHYLRQASIAKNLFHGVIADSGSTLSPWSITRNSRRIAFRIGLQNGIWTMNSGRLVEQLRKVNVVQLIKSAILPSLLDMFDALSDLPFAPCLEEPSDEAVYTEYSYEAQKNGHFNSGPLLHGFNSMEAKVINNLPLYPKLLLTQYNIFHSKLAPLDMRASTLGRKIVGDNIYSTYFKNQTVTLGPCMTSFLSDNEFIRGIVKTSELESHYSNVYLYRFSFTGGTNHTVAKPDGVAHAEELQYVFNLPEYVQTKAAAILTQKRMVEMWTNFVKTGNPTPKPTKTVNVTWPVVNLTGYYSIQYLDIGTELVPGVNPEEEKMQFWNEQYSKYGNPPYDTY